MRRFLAMPLALGVVLLTTPVLAQTSMVSTPGSMSMPSGQTPADKAMAAGMAQMQRDMAAAPMTGNADHDFVAMMIPHHQGAVSMAEVELKYGHDPFLRKLARDIIAAQNKEIAEMQAWEAAHPVH